MVAEVEKIAAEEENRPLTAEETEAMERELGEAAAPEELSAETIISTETGEQVIAEVATPQQEEAFVKEEYNLPKDLADAQIKSVLESILFASVHPISFAALKAVFSGTNVDSEKLTDVLNHLATDYAGGDRGICLEEVAGGYQLRTKLDNTGWLKKMVKARPFRLSGPALEVLSIIAYKQPVVKSEVDHIRGVESGHLVRALMEKNIVKFAGKSELPGKPMLYGTTKQFLELFGLRNIRELPTLSEIDKLIPEGIGDVNDIEGETLGGLADKIGLPMGKSYSDSEAELLSITEQLGTISTSSEFFEQEKVRERQRRDDERAQDLRERKIVGETLLEVDEKWLARFEAKVNATVAAAQAQEPAPTPAEPEAAFETQGETLAEGATERVMTPEEAFNEETPQAGESLSDTDLA